MVDKVGAVMVVGGGIAGVQSALDLANSGYRVYLVESGPAIGGKMAQLDKTFPTNDCSMCILSPKLVEVGRHKNIELMTLTDITGLEGGPGNFSVTLLHRPRYVDPAKCVACGLCVEKCPAKVPSEFDQGLKQRKAIYVAYPQAVPLKYAIDPRFCIKLTKGKCGLCSKVCPAGAPNYEDKPRTSEVKVGAVILAPGFDVFDAKIKKEYGYGIYRNVVTSMEFERILSASGPYEGHVLRPSDGKPPKRIAFLQCVGSRDPSCNREYCSSVCCMYSIKEAIIAREHDNSLDCRIFFMDIRAFGKEFDDYYDRAKGEYGIGFTRCRVSSVSEDPASKDLILTYESPAGVERERYDMAVLAVGFEPPQAFAKTVKDLGIAVNDHGFMSTDVFSPLDTSREGVFVSGAASAPKDIPDTVAQASGAASRASSLVYEARNTLVTKVELPPEKDVLMQRSRIGVFVCHCGINIGAVVNVPSVAEYAMTLPNVVFATDNIYTCSQDTQERMKQAIKEHDLNRIVVAACTPRTHEPLFRATLRQAGLNQYLFEMTNIRDQCSWVHMNEHLAATKKAKDLVRMAVAKARRLEPLKLNILELEKATMVVGGGVSGMTSARALARQGFKVILVEREATLGGNANHIFLGSDMKEVGPRLKALKDSVSSDPNIEVLLNTQVKEITGFVGKFETVLKTPAGARRIKHGAVIMTTGACANKVTEYGPNTITQQELEEDLEELKGNRFVMIQCAGSREPPRNYCSRFCCTEAIKNAIRIKKRDPDATVFILYRDIRTYGFKELLYREAQELGVKFVRYELPDKPRVEGKRVYVKDAVYGLALELEADHVVLSVGVVAHHENEDFSQMLKVPLSKDKFFLESHMKLRPVEFSTEGVYLAGLAHSPKFIEESISQAEGAASRAAVLLSKGFLEFEGIVSQIEQELCTGCGMCVDACPYHAIDLVDRKAKVNEALCKGCGVCGSTCRSSAAQPKNFKDDQILAMIKAAYDEEVEG